MAWSWSHTREAYINAENNLRNLPKNIIDIIWAEWQAASGDISRASQFSENKYNKAIKKAATMQKVYLADQIWENSSILATCDNGGYNAWVCPFGCHTVSFDNEVNND